MNCLRKYKWVKLHRACLPGGKGIMGYWAKLASRAAFRKGNGLYCGHKNPVTPGMWTGGIVGLKSILGVKRRQQALKIMCELESLGYLTFDLDLRTKKLSYQITDWVMACAGAECMEGAVYATEGYGFLCMPRSITDRLIYNNRTFDEADAWLDLWCHTIYRDRGNAFSFLGPAVQFGKYAAVLTLENLGRRWRWEKTKVWRFFKRHEDVFRLYRLPGSFGCVIYNNRYLTCRKAEPPEECDVVTLFNEIRMASRKGIIARSGTERINKITISYGRLRLQFFGTGAFFYTIFRKDEERMKTKCKRLLSLLLVFVLVLGLMPSVYAATDEGTQPTTEPAATVVTETDPSGETSPTGDVVTEGTTASEPVTETEGTEATEPSAAEDPTQETLSEDEIHWAALASELPAAYPAALFCLLRCE